MRRANRQLGPIGLDLDAGVIRAVQVSRTTGGFRVVAQARIERTDPTAPIDATELARIAAALDRQGFAGRSVVIAADQSRVRRLMLDLPPAGASVDALLFAREEFASAHNLAPGSFELASWELPAPDAGVPRRQALAAGLLHDDADAPAIALAQAGLSVRAIDLRCWALARAFNLDCEPKGVTIGLDFGWNDATLLAHHRGEIVYERAFEIAGIGALADTATDRLGVDRHLAIHALRSSARGAAETPISGMLAPIVEHALESLATDLRTALAFLDHRYDFPQPVRLVVTGDSPASPDQIADRLGLEDAIIVDPAGADRFEHDIACAVGLSLWEAA
ncbi:MAG: hypothetical protein ACF8QF_06090 [Phycisphaerales bacterium]